MKRVLYILVSTFFSLNILFAFDIAANLEYIKSEITGKSYNLDSTTELNGLYYRYTNTMWFFYSKKYDYLLIHETGKPTVAQGAKQYKGSSSFDSIKIENLCVSFGNNISDDTTLDALANQKFCLRNDTMSALYEKFDDTNNLWFAYFPKYDYMLIHETGKNKVEDGAYQINSVSSYFGTIVMPKDQFGNYLNIIEIGVVNNNEESSSVSSSESSSTSGGSETAPSVDSNDSSLPVPPSTPSLN